MKVELVVAERDVVTGARIVLCGEVLSKANVGEIDGFRSLGDADVVYRAPRAMPNQLVRGERWIRVPKGMLVVDPHPLVGRSFMEQL